MYGEDKRATLPIYIFITRDRKTGHALSKYLKRQAISFPGLQLFPLRILALERVKRWGEIE